MSDFNLSDDMAQLSLFDIITKTENGENPISADDLSAIAAKLAGLTEKQRRREKRKQRRQERKRKEREQREAEELRNRHIEEVTSMELPLDWENIFIKDDRTQGVHAESISDGLILSLSNLGRVDIEYISSITGEDYKTVIETLKGSIYQNPQTWGECFFMGWETADEYLSGNLRIKWNEAKEANENYNGYFAENIKALESVMPPSVAVKDIYITLGSPWVPEDIIDSFIRYLFGSWDSGWSRKTDDSIFNTKHDPYTGIWEIPLKTRYDYGNVKINDTYGTKRINALYILEKTLNMQSISIKDEVACPTNKTGKKRIVNQTETILALEKQQKLIKAFQDWVWNDRVRKARLEEIFESNFSCVRKRTFDGSFLKFPNLSPQTELRPYQKNAVARIIFTPNTLLAHDVGSGKTYIMIASGMELKRMKLSEKNMFVVPNNIIGQWRDIFLKMYPDAKLLCIEPKDFTPKKREAMLTKIRDEEFDGIIIAYSCFEQIPLSKDFYIDTLTAQKQQITQIINQSNKATSSLKKKHEKITENLNRLLYSVDELYDGIYFDELGITRLFVDEAHNFKNVPIKTKIGKVLGISKTGSKKCSDMMDKVCMIQRQNDGGGVIFATGTPITNSITDAFIMQKYLQSGELAMLDLQNFDSWVGMFAEKKTEFEIDVDTSSYRIATRFAKFHNLPELTSLLSSIADFHRADSSMGIPEHDGYNNAVISRTQEFTDYLKDISQRAEAVRTGFVNRRDDNMLKITTDGRKAALDIRLAIPSLPFSHQSKAMRCAENASDIYFRTTAQQSTQIIFCDISTPKNSFNMYDEIKALLIGMGVPGSQIAYVHSADSDAKRNVLFSKLRSGEIRILLGSTPKLGLGVNVQNKLIAIHHLDVPWRPSDMTQREGRILRQGNTNPKVYIFRYITEGSFDAYSWQLLETKQRFINDILSGSLTERSCADIEDTVLSYAEVKALAVGNPLVKQRVETANELSRYKTLQKKLIESKINLNAKLTELPSKIENQKRLIASCTADCEFYAEKISSEPVLDKRTFTEMRKKLREQLHTALFDEASEAKEYTLFTHHGFEVILPAVRIKEKPFVWLKRSGKYYVELGDTETGNLIRIDNYLDELPKKLEGFKDDLTALIDRQNQITEQLNKDESFDETIRQLSEKLEELDKRLGVKNK